MNHLRSYDPNELMQAALTIWAIFMKQSIDDSVRNHYDLSKSSALGLSMVGSLMVSAMYSSVVFTMLSVKKRVPNPENLYDLTYNFPDMRLHYMDKSSEEAFVKSSEYFNDLKDRIDVIRNDDTSDETISKLYRNVYEGSHATIQVTLISKMHAPR